MKKYFITGLVILLPLTITIAIVIFIVNFLTKPFIGFAMHVLSQTQISQLRIWGLSSDQVLRYGSQIIIIIGIVGFTLLLGLIARWFFFNAIIRLSDKLIHKIPIINKVYKTTQEIVKTLFITDKNSFKQVVMAPFPSEGMYSLGLVSRESPATCKKAKNQDLVSVFIPTTPNPTTGFLIMFKKEDLIFIKMSTEDAVKYIVSCGVIVPKEDKEISEGHLE